MNYEHAEKEFKRFIEVYDCNHDKISRKIDHTFGVVKLSEYIAKQLGLSDEDIELAKIIALLHDIGRFEQAKVYDNFDDYVTMDHGNYGVEILTQNGYIRKFIETDEYDRIILTAIKTHNKYRIEDNLSEEELLHSKIIRDADKLDNYRIAAITDVMSLATNTKEETLITQEISDEVFSDVLNCKSVARIHMRNGLDRWISYIGYLFDFNFDLCLEYVKEKDYINLFVDRFPFEKEETKKRMESIRGCAHNYIIKRIKNEI